MILSVAIQPVTVDLYRRGVILSIGTGTASKK